MLMFDSTQRMFDALRFGACDLVAHDRSLILGELTGPLASNDVRELYEEKFSFNEIAWGMAVRHKDNDTLGWALALITASAHGKGRIIELAQRYGVNSGFLAQQQQAWKTTACLPPATHFNSLMPACLIDPPQISDTPSVLAPAVEKLQAWLQQHFGIEIRLPMFSGEVSLSSFRRGIIVSIILVTSSIIATILFGLLFYRLQIVGSTTVRWLSRLIGTLCSDAPILLLLVLAYLITASFTAYNETIAVLTAVMAIGLYNGAPIGLTLVNTRASLANQSTLRESVSVSIVQIRACVINAAKCSPVGSFIGAPELLSVLTDITSFTGERLVTFTILSLFYILVIQIIIVISGWVANRLQQISPQRDVCA